MVNNPTSLMLTVAPILTPHDNRENHHLQEKLLSLNTLKLYLFKVLFNCKNHEYLFTH